MVVTREEKGEMKKYYIIMLVLLFGIYLFGCGRKEEAMDELQEPLPIELSSVSDSGALVVTAPEAKVVELKALPAQQGVSISTQVKMEPSTEPYKPTVEQIQAALKNAGYYAGGIDGKKGPLTKKAIEEFQKANNLQVDGKVGSKTWEMLKAHLNPVPATGASKKR
jgi:hypothetical protein